MSGIALKKKRKSGAAIFAIDSDTDRLVSSKAKHLKK